MFNQLDTLTLQMYWWIIVSLLAGLLVFMFFVQGGQTLLWQIGKNEEEKTMLVNSLGRKWELGYTTLVLFGGAMFAAFPLFYSVSFGGAYWVWLSILFSFTIQAVSYEFRKKQNNFLGAKTYETFLLINGTLGVILIGTAVATMFSGANFERGEFNFSIWKHPLRGLEAAFNLFNVLLGIALFFLARTMGAMYFLNNIDDEVIRERSRKEVGINFAAFLPAFLVFAVWLLLRSGLDTSNAMPAMQPYKYALSLVQMPAVSILLVTGVALVLYGVYASWFQNSKNGLWFTGPGTVLTVFSVLLLAGLNHASFYPSNADIKSSLTIQNASSSRFTLVTMSYVSLFVPVVLGYIAFVWRAMDSKKMTREEGQNPDSSAY